MIDAHNHLQDEAFQTCREDIFDFLTQQQVEKWVVNGTTEADWNDVARLAERQSSVLPFFGLHPWYLHEATVGWEDKLCNLLKEYPTSGVGEIGLDKWLRNPNLPQQERFFLKQWRIASEFQRPVTIHCLRCFGRLKELLQNSITRFGALPFLLHSYSGPAELVSTFVEMGAFFSISGYFFDPRKVDKLKVFESIPKNRLLIETDAPSMRLPVELDWFRDCEYNHPGNIAAVYKMTADQFFEGDLPELILCCRRNFDQFANTSEKVSDNSSRE